MFAYIDSINFSQIKYLSDSLQVCGYLVEPKKKGKYPVIIYNRGGNRDFGNLKVYDLVIEMGRIAASGYVVVASTYRGNKCSEGNDEFGGNDVHDVLNLIDALVEIPCADTSRIGMLGFSRGGMMTYLCLKKDNRIKAAATLGAPSDLLALEQARNEMQAVFQELIPKYSTNKNQVLENRSAAKWAHQFPSECPLLIMHGESDTRVPVSQATELCKQLEKGKKPYKLIIIKNADHNLSQNQEEFYNSVIRWFDTYLKLQ